MNNNYYKRLAQVEAMSNAQKAELEETLKAAYDVACEEQNEEDAATFARKLRNKLLADSDAQMSLDRLELDLSTATKFIDSLNKIIKGAWAEYRQALRDLPTQAGFPFSVEFPKPPDSGEDSENELI